MTTDIDVSEYQGQIDWHSVAESGVKRSFIKFSEGIVGLDHGIDPQAIFNIHNARAAGIHIGLYHYAHPKNDPAREANSFITNAKDHFLEGDIVPFLDLEVMEGKSLTQLANWKQTWFATVDREIKTLAGFYSYRSMLNFMYAHLKANRPIWGSAPGAALTTTEQQLWSWTQYSFVGRVPGITGNVDENALVGHKTIPVIPKLV